MKKVFAVIAGFATFYALAYFFLLVLNPEFLAWSSFVRGVSILAWVTVWSGPAYYSAKVWGEIKDQASDKIKGSRDNQ